MRSVRLSSDGVVLRFLMYFWAAKSAWSLPRYRVTWVSTKWVFYKYNPFDFHVSVDLDLAPITSQNNVPL